jgi:hypothetical protein
VNELLRDQRGHRGEVEGGGWQSGRIASIRERFELADLEVAFDEAVGAIGVRGLEAHEFQHVGSENCAGRPDRPEVDFSTPKSGEALSQPIRELGAHEQMQRFDLERSDDAHVHVAVLATLHGRHHRKVDRATAQALGFALRVGCRDHGAFGSVRLDLAAECVGDERARRSLGAGGQRDRACRPLATPAERGRSEHDDDSDREREPAAAARDRSRRAERHCGCATT